ncbi:MAG TPA: glycine cleavage system aminomethyltransferase GcvT [Actinomycetes bacterium]|nr:glycine cleavage system aminomethyltransferase GcvT [Actinomycetes bacterium]
MNDGLRHSPLHDRHVALGAKLADFGGWQMPIEYPGGGVLKEHAAVREAVGIFDVSHLGKLRVSGDDSRAFVNQMFTNDLDRIGPGRAQYSMLCDEDGGVVDDLIVYLRADDDVFVIPNASNTVEVVRRLSEVKPTAASVTNLHDRYGVIAVQGPRSGEVLRELGLPHDHDYMAFTDSVWNGEPVVVCRTGYTGEHGFELLPSWEATGALWDALLSAAAPLGGRPAGLGARDTLRTEMGYPLHGQDLSREISPVQARLGWAVGWQKQVFVGREALLAERRVGPARRLWGLLATDRGIPRPHMAVSDLTRHIVGEVTSGTFSPTLRQGIGLALLNHDIKDGDSVQVDVRGKPAVMTVVKPPFVKASTR